MPLQYDRYKARVETVTGAIRTYELLDPYDEHPGPGHDIWWTSRLDLQMYAKSGRSWHEAAANIARVLRHQYGNDARIDVMPVSYFLEDRG